MVETTDAERETQTIEAELPAALIRRAERIADDDRGFRPDLSRDEALAALAQRGATDYEEALGLRQTVELDDGTIDAQGVVDEAIGGGADD
jgi:hypothetical protein